jgi:hypothetical protein
MVRISLPVVVRESSALIAYRTWSMGEPSRIAEGVAAFVEGSEKQFFQRAGRLWGDARHRAGSLNLLLRARSWTRDGLRLILSERRLEAITAHSLGRRWVGSKASKLKCQSRQWFRPWSRKLRSRIRGSWAGRTAHRCTVLRLWAFYFWPLPQP